MLASSTQPKTGRAQKTAVFQLGNLSKHKRALVLDAMKRAHRAYGAVVEALLKRLDEVEAIEKKTERGRFMQDVIAYPTLRNWTLGQAGKAAARVDAIGAVESFIAQKKERPVASPPSLDPLELQETRRDEVLREFAQLGSDIARENELRDELLRVSKPPHPRPLGLYSYGRYYRLLRHSETRRLYAWIQVPARVRIGARFA